MRKSLLVLLIFTSVNSFAQFSTMFNDTLMPLGLGGYDFSCIAQDDSFYYAVGGVNNNQPLWDNMIVKFDKNFNVIKKRKFIDTIWYNANYPYNTISLNDKKLIFCTQQSKNQMSIIYGKIIALNKFTLDTLWTKTIEHPDTAYVNLPNADVFSDLTAIKVTSDGGYILTGNYNLQCSGANKRSFLLKIDSIGNVEWRRTYSTISYLYDVELTPNGGYIVINKYGGTNVTVLDSVGNILWQKKANNYIGMATSGDLCYAGNNSFIVTTPYMYNTDTNDPLMGINVFKINQSNKQIIFDKTYILYHNVECIGLHQDIGVETLADGSIIVNGTLAKYGADKSGFILKLNSNGDSLWSKTYNFSHSSTARCQLNDLMLTDDGGFLGVGFYAGSSAWSAWMFKTDENGVIGFEKTVAELVEAKVFPNPARDYTTIELSENLTNTAELKVYNTLGQLVLQRPLNKGEKAIKLDLKDFESGVYFFELIGKDGFLGSGKYVRE